MSGQIATTGIALGRTVAPHAVPRPPALIVVCAFYASLTALLLQDFLGSASAYAFLATWVLLGSAYGRCAVRSLRGGPVWPWFLPAFALLSTAWSQDPLFTLRTALEYGGTVGCAVLAASLLKPRTLVAVLTVALLTVAVVSVAVGGDSTDPMTGETTFVGVFASKNVLGFFASLMLLLGIALIIDGGQPLPGRMIGLLAVPASLPLLVVTRSATSAASVALSLTALFFGLMLSRLNRAGRARVLLAAVVILLPVGLLLIVAGDQISDALLRAMGRNATLTGRTDLWRYAGQIIPEHPLGGWGYQAFWRQDSVDAESLWAMFHIDMRAGFHFHNTYVETTVELGYPGAAILVVMLVAILRDAVRWSWRTGSVMAAFFVALMVCMVTRSFAEVEVMYPFSVGTFLLTVIATYAVLMPVEKTRHR